MEDLQRSLDAAVLNSSAWRDVCDRLAASLDGVGAVLVPEAAERQTAGIVASASLDGLLHTIFRDGWVQRNYRRHAIPIIKSRGYGTDLDIADAEVMKREPFYTDLMASQKLGIFIGLHLPIGADTYVRRWSGAANRRRRTRRCSSAPSRSARCWRQACGPRRPSAPCW